MSSCIIIIAEPLLKSTDIQSASRPDMEGAQDGILQKPGVMQRPHSKNQGTGTVRRGARLITTMTEKCHWTRASLPQGQGNPLEVSQLGDQQWGSQSHEGKEGPQAGHSILWRNFLRKNCPESYQSNTNIITTAKGPSSWLHVFTLWLQQCNHNFGLFSPNTLFLPEKLSLITTE